MNRFILSLIGFFTGCLYGCGQHDFKTVNADEFERIIANDSVQTVDVRTAEEFAEARISVKGLKNIDVKKPGFIESAVKVLDKTARWQCIAAAEGAVLTLHRCLPKRDIRCMTLLEEYSTGRIRAKRLSRRSEAAGHCFKASSYCRLTSDYSR